MRALRWLPSAFVIAIPLLAADEPQNPGNVASPNAAIDQALRGLPTLDVRPKEFSPGEFAYGARTARVCSVPLLEMPIPKDKIYTMKVLPAARGLTDNMPAVSGPAPPCPAKHE